MGPGEQQQSASAGADDTGRHGPGSGLALVIALGALASFGPLCLDTYLPALPALAQTLGSTTSMAQLTLTTCLIGLAVGQVVAGPLSDRLGRRAPLLVGVLLFAAASAACAVTTSMPLLLTLRLVQGACGAAGIVLSRAIVADRFSGAAAASMYAATAAVNGLSPILAPMLGGQILRFGSWRLVFWVLAGIGVALALMVLLALPESLPAQRRHGGGMRPVLTSFGVLLRDRAYVGYCLAAAFVMAAMFGYISASPFLLQDRFGMSQQQFSFSFAVNALGIILASWLVAVLVRRIAPVVLLRYAVAQACAGGLLLALSLWLEWGLWPVLAGFFVMVSAVGFANPPATTLAMGRHRDRAGSASALLGLAQFIFGAVTAPLVGLGDPTRGTALGLVSVLATLAAAAALLLTRSTRAGGPGRTSSPSAG